MRGLTRLLLRAGRNARPGPHLIRFDDVRDNARHDMSGKATF
jgi:hypothetical protein